MSYKIPSRDIVPLGRADEGHPILTSAASTIMVLDRVGLDRLVQGSEAPTGVFISIRISMEDIPLPIRERLATLNEIPNSSQFTNIPVDASGSVHIGYAHLQLGSIPPELEVGDELPSGTLIGRMGSSRNTYGAHLDLSVFYIPDEPGRQLDAIHFNGYPSISNLYGAYFEQYWEAYFTMYDEADRKPELYGEPVVVNPLVLWPSLQQGSICSFY